MKIKLFIDFDGTLFDTACFKEKIFKVFLDLGFNLEEIEKSYYDECRDYLYNPKGQAKRLIKIREFDLEFATTQLHNAELYSSQCVYADSREFLEQIDREKYEVVLLTLGNIGFQKAKYDNSGLGKYFDDALFTKDQKWDFLENIITRDEKFILIDDRGDTCKAVSEKFSNAVTIEINRGKSVQDPMEPMDQFSGIKVKNLIESNRYL